MRELILSDAGVTLADTDTAGGEVLMGTLRWEKERADRVANEVSEVARKLKAVRLDAEEAELEVRAKSLQVELVAKQVEKPCRTAPAKAARASGRAAAPAWTNCAVPTSRFIRASEYTMTRRTLFKFRLYVAGVAQNSMQAIHNLTALTRTHLPNRHAIEIIDVLQEPKRGLADGIYMTPTLVKLDPQPVLHIVGSLSQTHTVLMALGLDI